MVHEYPKHVQDKDGNTLTVRNAAEEAAVAEGRAIVEVTKAATGDVRTIAGIQEQAPA